MEHRVNPNEEKPFASVRLCVKAGNVCESEDESGIAHFVEHGVFLGTENYSNVDIDELLRSFGSSIGADVNAHTSNSETIYKLDRVPTDNHDNIINAIKLFYEFAHKATFPEDKCIAEREVIQTELLQRNQVSRRSIENKWKRIAPGNKYTDHLCAQLSPEVVNADAAELAGRLRKFYSKWYQPQNMAIIVVGNLGGEDSRDDVLSNLRNLFSQIPRPIKSKKNTFKDYPIKKPNVEKADYSVFYDSQLFMESINVVQRKKDEKMRSKDREYTRIKNQVYKNILSRILSSTVYYNLLNENGSALLSIKVTPTRRCTSSARFSEITICAHAGKALKAWEDFLEHVKRFSSYPQDTKEVCKIARSDIESIKKSMREEIARKFVNIINGYASNYIDGYNITDPNVLWKVKIDILNDLIQDKEQRQFNEIAAKCFDIFRSEKYEQSTIIFNTNENIPDHEMFCSSMADIYSSTKSSPVGKTLQYPKELDSLMISTPQPVEPIESYYINEIGCQVLVFDNGYKVYLKTTTDANSTIYLSSIHTTGAARMALSENDALCFGTKLIVAFPEFGGHSFSDIRSMLKKSNSFVPNWDIGYKCSYLNGKALSMESVELTMQMFNLSLQGIDTSTSEQFNNSYNLVIGSQKKALEKLKDNAAIQVQEAYTDVVYQGHSFHMTNLIPSEENLEFDIVTENLGSFQKNMSPGKVVICGSFELNEMMPLVKKYFGSLPNLGDCEFNHSYEELSPNYEGCVRVEKFGIEENRTTCNLIYHTPHITGERESLVLGLSVSVLQRLFQGYIRQEKQEIYSSSIEYCDDIMGLKGDHLAIKFISATANSRNSVKLSKDFIAEISQKKPNKFDDYFKECVKNTRKAMESSKNSSSYHNSYLKNYISNDFDLSLLAKRSEWLEEISEDEVYDCIKNLLSLQNSPKILIVDPK